MTKACNRCGLDGLEWDKIHHENTGKWRLINSDLQPHRCISNKKTHRLILKYDLVHCGMCPDGCGWCTKEQLERHNSIYHPHGEIVENQYVG